MLVAATSLAAVAVSAAPANRFGRPVRGFASPGDYPEGLAWDGARLWSNNYSNGTLYAVDPLDGRILRAHSGGGLPIHPEGLAWDGTHLWSCDWTTGKIFKLRDTGSGIEIVADYPPPAEAGGPVGLEWDGAHLWLATWGPGVGNTSRLFKLDPVTLGVVQQFELPVWWVEDLAWDGEYLWSADWLFRKGFAIDPSTGDTLHTYTPPGPNTVGMAWDGTHLWISDTTKDSIWALDIARPTAVESRTWSWVKRAFR
jgi:sugar lactone lactonase YvrE